MTKIPTSDEVKEGRKALGLSQQQMADLMGYGAKSRIYEIEGDRKSMSGPAAVLFRIMTGETTVEREIFRASGREMEDVS